MLDYETLSSYIYKKHHRNSFIGSLQNEVLLVISADLLKLCEEESGEDPKLKRNKCGCGT